MASTRDTLPVTTIVRAKPKPGFEKEALNWLHFISTKASGFSGYLGSDIFERANGNTSLEFAVIFHFDTYENLMRWEDSEERKEEVRLSESLFAEARSKIQLVGLEYWFEGKSAKQPPSEWKMAIVTVVVIFTLLNTLIPWLGQLLNKTDWPVLLKSLLSIILLVALMSYVIMPFVTKILSGWLFKNSNANTNQ